MSDRKMIDANCGNCIAWKFLDTPAGAVEVGAKRRGVCFGAPPTAIAMYDRNMRITGQTVLRPCPAEDDTCLLFVPRADLMPAEPPPH